MYIINLEVHFNVTVSVRMHAAKFKCSEKTFARISVVLNRLV
jgi:hypothetical protein